MREENLSFLLLLVCRNVDRSNFSPLIGLFPIPTSESTQLSLVAVTANGVRYYFSITNTNSNPMTRPHGLYLQHIRLPPGFAASSPIAKPSKVHMAFYKQGTLLLASAQSDETDLLWMLSSDLFPFQNLLVEGQSTIQLDGRVWAMTEVPQHARMMRLYKVHILVANFINM